MTAKILYWNVEKFGNKKISDTGEPGDDPDFDDNGQLGPLRLAYMLDTFAAGQHPLGTPFLPDFIIIVEVGKGTAGNQEGQLVNANGANGVAALLNAIRQEARLIANGEDWRAVPPIVVGEQGRGEGVAVFYNSAAWYFLGPDDRGAAYPAPFQRALPHRRIPNDYGIAAYQNKWEDRQLGQWQYPIRVRAAKQARRDLKFPGAGNRPPWLTYFGTVAGNPPTLLRLMSVHTSPPTAADGTKQVAKIDTMMDPMVDAAQQIDVILGDFNVGNLDAANWAPDGPLRPFLIDANPRYAAILKPNDDLEAQYDSYYMTQCRKLSQSKIEENNEPYGHYPGYGYLSLSIDNAFVRRHNVAPPAVQPNATIVDRVFDNPYRAAAGPPVPAPYTGVITYANALNIDLPNILTHLDQNPEANDAFREWPNFGRIRSTSDHLPLIFEV